MGPPWFEERVLVLPFAITNLARLKASRRESWFSPAQQRLAALVVIFSQKGQTKASGFKGVRGGCCYCCYSTFPVATPAFPAPG